MCRLRKRRLSAMLPLILLVFPLLADFKRLPQIYWNSTNPLVERYAAIGDTLDIICPYFEKSEKQNEQSIIYRVSEEEYENCEVKSTAKELGRCTQPYEHEKLKVAFRLMSPNPSGLDYRPGMTYYFISTSTGTRDGLNNEFGGLCASHSLKMVIHITDKNGDIHHHHRHHHQLKKLTTTTTEKSTTTTTKSSVTFMPDAEKMWEQFYEKIMPMENSWQEIPKTRGERLNLYAGNKKDEYEQIIPMDQEEQGIAFEIHEISDPEELTSTTISITYILSFSLSLLMLL